MFLEVYAYSQSSGLRVKFLYLYARRLIMSYVFLLSLTVTIAVVGWLLHSFFRELTHPHIPDLVEHQMEAKRGSKF